MTDRTTSGMAPTIWFLATTACSGGLCANTISNRAASPDGRRDAVVFTRDCGATTDYSTQVTLVSAGASLPNRAGMVFVAPYSTDVRVKWIGSDTLLVQNAVMDPNLKVDHIDGVTIRYGPLP